MRQMTSGHERIEREIEILPHQRIKKKNNKKENGNSFENETCVVLKRGGKKNLWIKKKKTGTGPS